MALCPCAAVAPAASQSPLLLCCFYLLGMGVVCNWVALLQCQDYLGPLFTVRGAALLAGNTAVFWKLLV